MKDWVNQIQTIEYYKLNQIIIKQYVQFYHACWLERNEIFHSKEKQKEYVLKWHKKTKYYVELIGGEAKKYTKTNKVNTETASIAYIKDWIKKF